MKQFKKIIPILVICAFYGIILAVYYIDTNVPISDILEIAIMLIIGLFVLYKVKDEWRNFLNR